MRSDRVGEGAATSNVAMNVRDKYQRAKFELDGLPAARSTVERLDGRNVPGGIRCVPVPSRLEASVAGCRVTMPHIPRARTATRIGDTRPQCANLLFFVH